LLHFILTFFVFLFYLIISLNTTYVPHLLISLLRPKTPTGSLKIVTRQLITSEIGNRNNNNKHYWLFLWFFLNMEADKSQKDCSFPHIISTTLLLWTDQTMKHTSTNSFTQYCSYHFLIFSISLQKMLTSQYVVEVNIKLTIHLNFWKASITTTRIENTLTTHYLKLLQKTNFNRNHLSSSLMQNFELLHKWCPQHYH